MGRFMLKFLRCCFYLSVSMCASALGKTSQEVEYPGIIAYVDEEIILQQDLNERINIIKMSVGGRYDSGMDKTALNELVLEKIRWHLLKKYAPPKGWTDPREIEEIYESIAKQNNLSSDKFTVVLQKQNIDAKNFKHSIEVNLAWNRYIEARYGSGINISQHELTEIKKGIETRKNQPAFYLSRIYIPADDQTFKQASD